MASQKIFRTAYGDKVKDNLTCDPETGRTKQSHKDECDINNIIKKYNASGIQPALNKMSARFGVIGGEDFHTAMNKVTAAQDAFNGLPSHIRTQFDNDPGFFLDFVNDPSNIDKLREMGLAKPIEAEPKASIEPAAPPAAEPAPAAAAAEGK